MALPTLDATFASSADLPRKQMLAKWLVEELGETQAPSDVLVSGFDPYGDYDLNGIYSYFDIVNNKPRYKKTAIDSELNERVIYLFYSIDYDGSEGFGWFVFSEDLGVSFAVSPNENVDFPWNATGWEVYDYGSGSPVFTESQAPSPLSNYYSLPERYLWAKIAVAAGAPRGEADYISLPKNYAWSDIYNAVAGSSDNHTDWTEKQALGHIAAAYRGDTGNPANLATYIDWPWRYQVASIIQAL